MLHSIFNFVTFWCGVVIILCGIWTFDAATREWSLWIAAPVGAVIGFIVAYIWVGSFWWLERKIFGFNKGANRDEELG